MVGQVMGRVLYHVQRVPRLRLGGDGLVVAVRTNRSRTDKIVVVDSGTGRPHIAVRPEQIALFAKMIRTR